MKKILFISILCSGLQPQIFAMNVSYKTTEDFVQHLNLIKQHLDTKDSDVRRGAGVSSRKQMAEKCENVTRGLNSWLKHARTNEDIPATHKDDLDKLQGYVDDLANFGAGAERRLSPGNMSNAISAAITIIESIDQTYTQQIDAALAAGDAAKAEAIKYNQQLLHYAAVGIVVVAVVGQSMGYWDLPSALGGFITQIFM